MKLSPLDVTSLACYSPVQTTGSFFLLLDDISFCLTVILSNIIAAIVLCVFFLILLNVYFWDRDRTRAEEGQREGDRESETGSRIQAVSKEPDVGLEPKNHEIMT